NTFAYTNHLWSLAIEEQFYMLWPVIVLATGMRTLATLSALAVVGALACRLYLFFVAGGSPIAALAFLPSRVGGLALGRLGRIGVRDETMRRAIARIVRRVRPGPWPLALFVGVSFVVTTLTVSQQTRMSWAYGPGLTAVAIAATLLLATLAVPNEAGETENG